MKSIKHKLWFSILGVSMAVILAIWLFQVVFLERFYLAGKKQEILQDTQIMASTINDSMKEDFPEYSETVAYLNAIRKLDDIAYEKRYYIQLVNNSGLQIASIGAQGKNSILQYNFKVREQIIQNLFASGEEYFLQENVFSVYGERFYIGATYQENNFGSYILLIEHNLASVTEAVETIKHQLVFISVFLFLLASLAAFLLARSLTSPILKISEAAREIAKGNLGIKVSVKSKDELGRLSNDFNVMSKEIAKASTLQRELVANVSHDIRTPLTMIKGYAETIKDLTGDHKEKRNQQLDIIIEESNRLNTLVNDILDLSRLQAGQLPIEKKEFDLAAKLRDIIKRYDLLTSNEGFVFSLTAPDSVTVYADEVKIEQVIYNIINNATNHTGADKQVRVILEDKPDKAIVKIEDTGAGIKPEDLPLIWDRYYKPYKKNDRKGMGTGLGLSIVKAILTEHHFEYGVDSVLGQGSTFWFEVKKRS